MRYAASILALMALAACCNCQKASDGMSGGGVSTGINALMAGQMEDIKRTGVTLNSLTASNKTIITSSDQIDEVTDLPPAVASANRSIRDASRDIDKDINSIKTTLAGIEASSKKMASSESDVRKLELKITDLKRTAEILENENAKKLYDYIALFWVAGFLLIAGGIALAFFINKMAGGSIALTGVIVLGLASASQYYLREIAQVGFAMLVAGMVGAVGFIIYMAWRQRRTDVALSEVVEMVDELKKDLSDEQLKKIFGDNGVALKLYSTATCAIVDHKRAAHKKDDGVDEDINIQ
jgi:hypothetical protein